MAEAGTERNSLNDLFNIMDKSEDNFFLLVQGNGDILDSMDVTSTLKDFENRQFCIKLIRNIRTVWCNMKIKQRAPQFIQVPAKLEDINKQLDKIDCLVNQFVELEKEVRDLQIPFFESWLNVMENIDLILIRSDGYPELSPEEEAVRRNDMRVLRANDVEWR